MYIILLFCLIFIVALVLFGYAVNKRIAYLRMGGKEDRVSNPGERLKGLLLYVFGQRKLLKEGFGIVHFCIFWGFIIISFGTLQFIGEGLVGGFILPVLGDNTYFYFIKDIFSILVLVALVIAAYRRYIIRPQRIEANWDAAIIYLFIAGLIISEFIASGIRLALHPEPYLSLAPLYNAIALTAGGAMDSTLHAYYTGFWWGHVVLLLGFLVYLPYSKHVHLLAAPFNVLFRSLKPRGAQINPMDLEDENREDFGANRMELLTWKQLLDSFACAECGRCQDNCPAYLSGKPLSPKFLIHNLKEHILEKGEILRGHDVKSTEEAMEKASESEIEILNKNLIGDVITKDELWSCTSCFSCQEQCPVLNEHLNKIIDMRRSLVLEEGDFPQEAQLACRNVENNSNPWGIGWSNRADWAEELGVKLLENDDEVDILYWPGCAGAFDERSKRVATAFTRIMQNAGVNFGILGTEEKCCGDFSRRLGNEYLFQMQAEENIEILNNYGLTRIVTTCPHCFNTLKNEYPDFGGNYEVLHHTQYIAQLIKDGKLKFNENAAGTDVAYHDSCYLGRYNEEYNAPREILRSIPGINLLEINLNKERSFCCGAGGGRMWMEENIGKPINQMRVEQIMDTNPETVALNCPFCLTMTEDGLKSKEIDEKIEVFDVAEIVANSLLSSKS